MTLQAGTRLGPYEVATAIGAGGMGEVYRAHDTRLHRDVALKILPELFAADPERLARFKREAQVLASLNHPHIAAIYGLEESPAALDSARAGEAGHYVLALVLELVEGPTLADRIAQGPMPLEEALPIARQIAEALEAAHESGIVHRDLKPANIKVRPDGSVKVLDFGLAKAFEGDRAAASAAAALSMSPTITSPAVTGVGVILGTAAYMSPEQARGKAVDKRSDIWAFGCVLYEMLTGRRTFNGDDVTDVLARVLERDVDFSALPPATPPSVRRLLRRCLQKDRNQRLTDIGVARLEIDEARNAAVGDSVAVAPPSTPSWHERVIWAVGIVVAAALAAAGSYYSRPASPPAREVRFEIPVPPMRFPFEMSISPDGQRIVFAAATPDGRQGLWLRPLDTVRATVLAGSETNSTQSFWPAWSPDGRYVVYGAEGSLKKIDTAGGSPETLTALGGQSGGATWNRDNVIVFAANGHGLRRIAASGGPVSDVSTLDASLLETYHDGPVFLPDGRHFLYLAWSNAKPENRAIYIASLDSPSRTRLMSAESNAMYAQGHLLFMRGDALVAQPFDPDRLQLAGEANPVAQRVAKFGGEVGAFAVSAAGALLYRESTVDTATRQLVWLDRSGKSAPASDAPFQAANVRLSPDGQRVAFVEGAIADVWVYDLVRKLRTRLTTDQFVDHNPVWSPDGSRIVFDSHRPPEGVPVDTDDGVIFEKPSNGATEERPIVARERGVHLSPRDWAVDGRTIILAKQGQNGRWNLWWMPTGGAGKPVPYRISEASENEASLSPDGRFLAFTSNESGKNEVLVQPFPDPRGGKWQISTDGGSAPRWRRDGRELYYIDPKGRIVIVSVTMAPMFAVRQTGPLVQTPLQLPLQIGGATSPYDVTADGQRFLIAAPLSGSTPAPIIVRMNWNSK